MLEAIDKIKREASSKLDQNKRSELGQYMTPYAVAKFMSGLFDDYKFKTVKLLDAGAGIGSLSLSFFDNLSEKWKNVNKVEFAAYEVDAILSEYLSNNINDIAEKFKEKNIRLTQKIKHLDFIAEATNKEYRDNNKFTHVILNPPYKKINSSSEHRKLLSSIGIETVNLYSAFIALSIRSLKPGGELVAIIPRSFCNGNYYKPFRKLLIEQTAIKQIHLFESRTQAFKDDEVLQENVIIHLKKGASQKKVKVSKSQNAELNDYEEIEFPFENIVKNEDAEYFIHIPSFQENHIENSDNIIFSLSEIDLQISTGPVVDFRIKEHIQIDPAENTVPLLYPVHFNCKEIDWPKVSKKPNAIAVNEATKKMLYPSGFYTIVKRFSSKEEKQRIVARVVNPEMLVSEYIGLENHLNVFHFNKGGIDADLAYGLAAYLNSSYVDRHFRSFNGHTQVNATDLKQMKYPERQILITLGRWARTLPSFDQLLIDNQIQHIL